MKVHIEEEIKRLYVRTINIIASKKDDKATKVVLFTKLAHEWVIAYSYLKDLQGNDKNICVKKMYDIREKIVSGIIDNMQKKNQR